MHPLVTPCASCNEPIVVKSNASTRPNLAKENGEILHLEYTKCRNITKKHVNDIQAKENLVFIAAGILISLIVTLVLWNILAGFSTISLAIPLLIWQGDSKAAHSFIRYRLKRD